MGRLKTTGFEIGLGPAYLDGDALLGAPTLDTTIVRTGTRSVKFDSAGGGSAQLLQINTDQKTPFPFPYHYFWRFYLRFQAYPDSGEFYVFIHQGARLQIDATGQLWHGNVAGNAKAQTTLGQWHLVEVRIKAVAGASDECEFRFDGALVSNSSSIEIADTGQSGIASVGWGTAVVAGTLGTNKVLYLDDWAVNNDQGTDQNSFAGPGSIVLGKPIGDTQQGSWTGGAGGTTALYEAVNNTPPVGTATETDTSQIESADTSGDNATDEYRATMTDYLTAGVPADATVKVVQALVDHGEDVSTGTKTGSFRLFSNPEQVTPNTFEFGDNVGALGTWPTNWRTTWGTAQYDPTVTLGDSPVVALRKTDTGNRTASVDFIGIYVEYEEEEVLPPQGLGNPAAMALLGVGW